MNHRSIFLLLALLCIGTGTVSAKDIVINYPVYEFSNTGISHVTKIELRRNETRVHVHTTFIPGWWVKFDAQSYLEDCDTGEKWTATGIEKGEFGKEIFMPASGDSTFVILFPPLNKQVKRINYKDDDATIYGLSLNPKEKAKSVSKEIPTEVSQWMEGEIAKANQQTLSDLSREHFFRKDTARIVGYIRGYSPKSGLETALIYLDNELTREDHTRVIEIFEDGRFEGKLPLDYPIYSSFRLKNSSVAFYIEPGHTLGIVLDWDDFLQADRYRNIRYKFQQTRFAGPLGRINTELATVYHQLPDLNIREIYNKGFKLEVTEFQAFADSATAPLRSGLQALLKDESLHPTTHTVLHANHEIHLPYWYAEYEMSKAREDYTTFQKANYYDFLKKMPLDDHTLLIAPETGIFLNRLEYCAPFLKIPPRAITVSKPAISLQEYLYEELGLQQTPEDEKYFQLASMLGGDKPLEGDDLTEFQKQSKAFNEKYAAHVENYIKTYKPVEQPSAATEWAIKSWADKDSVYTNVLGLAPGIIYDITKVRSLKFTLGQLYNREEAGKVINALTGTMSPPFLRQEAVRLCNQAFPAEKLVAYELPVSEKGTNIFRKAIEPHKGKYIFVDFWATTCGPCIYGIKQMKETRAKYKDHPEAVFVFLTSERESPLDAYNKFVGEQDMEFTHRLSDNEYAYLRQLFSFNGIPRYVLVDKEGKIISNNYNMYQFNQTAKELGIHIE